MPSERLEAIVGAVTDRPCYVTGFEGSMSTPRLNAIVNITPELGVTADIGCDHGKTGIMLLECGKAKRIIFSDISEKSLEKARKLTAAKGLEERVSLRLGDGLRILQKGEADAAVISGMGGELTAKILEEGKEKAPDLLVLSPNTKPEAVRKWLCGNGYRIEGEDMVLEGRHFYPVILAKKGEPEKLCDLELELGPVLLEKKPPEFIRYVQRKIEKTEEKRKKILGSGTKNAAALLVEIDLKRKEYEEAIKCL